MFKPLFIAALLLAAPAFADPPVIRNVNAQESGGLWSFDVTITNADNGWDD
jgi:hypothetical protein